MKHEIIFSPEAIQDLRHLSARDRATVLENIEIHLRFTPDKPSRSRIKRLRGLSHPQYRLRIGEIRAYYDITLEKVQTLAIVPKSKAAEWLNQFGEFDNETGKPG